MMPALVAVQGAVAPNFSCGWSLICNFKLLRTLTPPLAWWPAEMVGGNAKYKCGW